jgi:hypothetical protein
LPESDEVANDAFVAGRRGLRAQGLGFEVW